MWYLYPFIHPVNAEQPMGQSLSWALGTQH